jgi:hypothetical protein
LLSHGALSAEPEKAFKKSENALKLFDFLCVSARGGKSRA